MLRIEKIVIDGKAQIHVDEIPLTHKRLGGIDVAYAFGQGSVAGKRALVVVTEHADGTTLSVRPNPEDRTGSE